VIGSEFWRMLGSLTTAIWVGLASGSWHWGAAALTAMATLRGFFDLLAPDERSHP
jgi:hypothetical protein